MCTRISFENCWDIIDKSGNKATESLNYYYHQLFLLLSYLVLKSLETLGRTSEFDASHHFISNGLFETNWYSVTYILE